MRKIILINNALTSGGAERFIAEMANYLDNSGVETTIVLLNKAKIHFDINKNIKIIEPKNPQPHNKFKKLLYFIYLFFYLRKCIRHQKPDLVFNLAYPTFVLFSIGNLVPLFISIRCDPYRTALIEGFRIPLFIRKYFYKKSKGIIAQTSEAAKILKKQFKSSKLTIIPNYIPLPYLQEYDLFTEKKNNILFVGRLIKSKGLIYLLNAFKSVDNKNWKLDIVGDGPEKKNIADFIIENNLTDQVTLHGEQKYLLNYYKRSKIFVFPSLSEGFPNALLEAMSMGCACISFDCKYGPAEIIQNTINGILVETGNQNELNMALQSLINNNDEINRLMINAQSVRQIYNQEKIMSQFIKEFNHVK
jgi:glycosyltransferase involved in cell wall biosynthesis